MRVEVIRGAGDRLGPEINDSLLTTEEAGRERGRVEIDRNSTPRDLVSLTLPGTRWLAPGSLVEVQDLESATWRGQVMRCRLATSRDDQGVTATTTIEIEREAL
jgi:hypothetical protein